MLHLHVLLTHKSDLTSQNWEPLKYHQLPAQSHTGEEVLDAHSPCKVLGAGYC